MVFIFSITNAQTEKYWSDYSNSKGKIVTNKNVARQSFPKEFKLFQLKFDPLRAALFSTKPNSNPKNTLS